MDTNFTFQDITGISLALMLFAFIFIFPGHLTGWVLNVFDFRRRTLIVQLIMGMSISLMITPALFYLMYRYSTPKLIIGCLAGLAIVGSGIIFVQVRKTNFPLYPRNHDIQLRRNACFIMIFWVVFSVITLVDVQIGNRLYFSNNAYDLTTRVSVVNAITRTGVPPINPSYYPGKAVELNFLYYYWYVLGSIVDQMGGKLVSPYHAMLASITWAGLLLCSATATYLRLRNNMSSTQIWKKSLIAFQLFAISGLDIIALSILIPAFKISQGFIPLRGHIEGWNMPVMSWLNALTWVPHHVVAALACILSIPMLLYVANEESFVQKMKYVLIVGVGFASAFGLSVWVMIVFGVYWVIWAIYLIFSKRQYQMALWMFISALFGVFCALPFLVGLLQKTSSVTDTVLPIALYVRPFILGMFVPDRWRDIFNLLLLPTNYFFEFGFFFMIATIWYRNIYKTGWRNNPLYVAELILVITSTLILSFVYSNLIAINDMGIRGWLPMQFVLIVWASDLLLNLVGTKTWITPRLLAPMNDMGKKVGRAINFCLVMGLLMTVLEFISLRTWSVLVDLDITGPNNGVSPDIHLGQRTYDARLAYTYLQENAPNAIVQNNPRTMLDRAAGLYGTNQMVISDRTAYGIPTNVFKQLSMNISSIFNNPKNDWTILDSECRLYFIDFIIVNDTDPLWKNSQMLSRFRNPFYQNDYYVIYPCGIVNRATSPNTFYHHKR